MRQTQKGKTWHFGMKVHVGTDPQGIVHSLTTTDAAQADIMQLPQLLHGEERALYGDQAYWSETDREAAKAAGVQYRVNRRGTPTHPLSPRWRLINQARSRVRACGEHAFGVVKHLWGSTKVRYRGLAKNTARVLRSSPWPTCTCCATDWGRQARSVGCRAETRVRRPDHGARHGNAAGHSRSTALPKPFRTLRPAR